MQKAPPMVAEASEIQALFHEALNFDSHVERAKFLDGACQGNSSLRNRVEALLGAHSQAGDFLGGKPDGLASTVAANPPEVLGTAIGPYKLREVLGEGGMGIVYAAEQEQPIRRRVALKVIKPGMDSKEIIGRFAAERQALALMDHPNIAKVLDAGTTESGRPYFVMEFVRGMPITEYCDRAKLPLRERLKLFITVCQAIQHAHQKGIIHRDLKPSNVMITLHDGTPVPKVIDFGVAKALNQRLTEQTVYTRAASLVGTPMYMSPEQAELSGLDVDTRSDVYALGTLLYELLTGHTPFDKARLSKAGYDELRRIIREDEPPRPSQRINTLTAADSTTVSAQRGIDARKLQSTLHGELDWIVMKALEKDRNRRYESASAFAVDVERYIQGDAVEACPPSAGYRLRKFVQRNSVMLVTTALVAIALVAGTGVSVWQAIRAVQAQAKSDANAQKARDNLKKAREAVDQMLVRVSDRLKDEPQMEQVRTQLLQDALNFYAAFLQQDASDPELQYEAGLAHLSYGNLQSDLGEPAAAEQTYNQAVGIFQDLVSQSPGNLEYRQQLAHCYTKLGHVLKDSGRMADAENGYRNALEIARQLSIESPQFTGWLAGRLNNVGICLQRQGRLDEAEAIHREALAIRRKNPDGAILESLFNLGTISYKQYKLDEAESYFREALEVVEKATPSDQQRTDRADIQRMLAEVLESRGNADFTEVEAHLRERILFFEKLAARTPDIPGHRHDLANRYVELANILADSDRPAEAVQLHKKSLAIHEQLVSKHPNTADYLSKQAYTQAHLGYSLSKLGKSTEAVLAYRQAVTIYESLVQQYDKVQDHRVSLCYSMWNLASALEEIHESAEAVAVMTRCSVIAEQTARAFPQDWAAQDVCPMSYARLGYVHFRRGEWETAVISLEQTFEHEAAAVGLEQKYTSTAFDLAIAYWHLRDYQKARKWFEEGIARLDRHPTNDEYTHRSREEAGMLLEVFSDSPVSAADAAASAHAATNVPSDPALPE